MSPASPVVKGWFTPAQVNQRHRRRTILVEVDAAQAEILDAALEAFGRHERVPLTFAIGVAAEAVATCLVEGRATPAGGASEPPPAAAAALSDPALGILREILAEVKGVRGEFDTFNRVAVTISGKLRL